MRKDKEIATNLRALGKSYSEIEEELKIPKSTLSGWFKGADWSAQIRGKLIEASKEARTVRLRGLDQVRGQRLKKAYEEAREEAQEELETLRYHPLFIAGLMLYFGGGDRATKNQVRLSSADPELIRLYMGFLQGACQIPFGRIKAYLVSYPELDDASNLRFWSFASGIPMNRFTKTAVAGNRGKPKGVRYGVCTIVVSNAYFKAKIMEWLRLLPKELMQKQYYENIGPEAAIV